MYTFPFTTDSILQQFDGKLTVYRNELPFSEYSRLCKITINNDFTVSGSPEIKSWSLSEVGLNGGILFLLDEKEKPLYRIDSLEVTNGIVHAMGESLREAKSIYSKLVLSRHQVPDFRICISSHRNYCEQTIPRLMKSLKRVGLDNNVLVVIADTSKHPKAIDKSSLSLDDHDMRMSIMTSMDTRR